MVIAAVGLSAVGAYSVTRRTREIGIRSALGAEPQHLVRLVLRRSLIVISTGSLSAWASRGRGPDPERAAVRHHRQGPPWCSRGGGRHCCWSGAVPPGCPLDVPRALTLSIALGLSSPSRWEIRADLYFFGPVFDARYPGRNRVSLCHPLPFLVFP